jgi:hypothetical protein
VPAALSPIPVVRDEIIQRCHGAALTALCSSAGVGTCRVASACVLPGHVAVLLK